MNPLFNDDNFQGKVAFVWSHNPPGELVAWSRCYQYAAQTLAKNLLEVSDFADRDSFPIVFLYRHALELCLKALLVEAVALCKLEGETPKFHKNILGKHNLVPLMEPINNLFIRFQNRFNTSYNGVLSYNEVLEIVHAFDQIDSQSFAFRYPVDKSFEVALLPHSLDFSIANFIEKIDPCGLLSFIQLQKCFCLFK